MIISHLLLVNFIGTICLQNYIWICPSATFFNVNGRATSDKIDVLEDLSETFSNVNDRATSDQIEALEDRIETILSNMTLFENITGK